MAETVHSESPHSCLIRALESVEKMQGCLVIYEGVDGTKCGSFDSDLSVAEALYLVRLYEHWLLLSVLGDSD